MYLQRWSSDRALWQMSPTFFIRWISLISSFELNMRYFFDYKSIKNLIASHYDLFHRFYAFERDFIEMIKNFLMVVDNLTTKSFLFRWISHLIFMRCYSKIVQIVRWINCILPFNHRSRLFQKNNNKCVCFKIFRS